MSFAAAAVLAYPALSATALLANLGTAIWNAASSQAVGLEVADVDFVIAHAKEAPRVPTASTWRCMDRWLDWVQVVAAIEKLASVRFHTRVRKTPLMQTPSTIKLSVLAFTLAFLLTTPIEAQPIEFEGATAGLIQVTAKVDAVDEKGRLITMTGPEGNTVVVEAGPKVKNFDRIRAGDDIDVSYYEELAVVVTRGSGPPPTEQEGFAASEGVYDAPPATAEVDVAAEVAPKGAEPGVAAAEVVTIHTTIEAVEYDTRIVTLAGRGGIGRRVKVGPAVELDQLKQGDKVAIQITKAIAVDVKNP